MLWAPFFNPSNNIAAWDFKRFLENQAKKGFSEFHTAQSRITEIPGLLDENGNTYKHVMWPPIKKEKVISIARPLLDGSLRTIKFSVYDHVSLTAVIRLSKNQIRVNTAKDLLMFCEHDIMTLSRMQIIALENIFAEAAKEYTAMIAQIIEDEIWAGALAGMDVHIVTLRI